MRRLLAVALPALVTLAGCAPAAPPASTVLPSPDAAGSPARSAEPSPAPTGEAAPAASGLGRPRLTPTRTITGAGVGPARVGMTLAEGVTARVITPTDRFDCLTLETDAFLKAFPGLGTEWDAAGLRALAVASPDYATEAGVRAGDSRAALRKAYGGRLREVPRDLTNFANLGGRNGPLAERFGPTIPAVSTPEGTLLFPIYEGAIDHIEVVPTAARLATFRGQCS